RTFRHGTFAQMVEMRAWFLLVYVVEFWWLVAWYILACFLVGVYLMRRGVFHDPAWHRHFLVMLVLLGACVGVPLEAAAAVTQFWRPDSLLSWSFNTLGALPQALGYLALLVWWSHTGRWEWLQRRLRAVGRMALTNYLTQSVLCGLFFYGHGR